MTSDAHSVLVCSGGAAWELALVRGLGRPELGIRVARRCVDHGELLGTALRDRPRAVLVDASLPWVDRDFVTTLRRAGIETIAVGSSARPLEQVGIHCLPADTSPEAVSALVFSFDGAPASVLEPVERPGSATAGRLVGVWGASGAPGRTTVAIHLAIEAANNGNRTLLIDADVWYASIAQSLELDEAPSITQAARLAADGWAAPITDCVQAGPNGVAVLVGLARAELWPEVREESWRAVLAAAVLEYEVVVVDLATPIEEDEELVFDRVLFRRNLVTTTVLELADEIVMVVAADPIGLRRAVMAHQALTARTSGVAEVKVILNRTPRSGRRLQDCSRAVSAWIGARPAALLPQEADFVRVMWEGRPLHEIAPRSAWLRELRVFATVVTS
ncbi:MAG: hypothetical protein ABIP21_03070 [Acidimicrobiia bacterium]